MDDFEIDIPVSQLPDLTELGIEETDRGVCEDTFENRKVLRANKFQWRPLYSSTGEPTTLIQAYSPEMLTARANQLLNDKGPILKDPRNKNSDYLQGWDLLGEERADDLVPTWVLAATRKFVKTLDQREATGKMYQPSLASAPGRCQAVLSTGFRCQYWHGGRAHELIEGLGYCRTHLGHQRVPLNLRAKIRERMESAALGMVENLEQLANDAESEPVRLKATTEYLDRIGIRGGFEVDATVSDQPKNAGELIAQRLKKLLPAEPSGETEEVEDAVIVEDGEPKDTER